MITTEIAKKIINEKHPGLVQNWGESAQLLSFNQVIELMKAGVDYSEDNFTFKGSDEIQDLVNRLNAGLVGKFEVEYNPEADILEVNDTKGGTYFDFYTNDFDEDELRQECMTHLSKYHDCVTPGDYVAEFSSVAVADEYKNVCTQILNILK